MDITAKAPWHAFITSGTEVQKVRLLGDALTISWEGKRGTRKFKSSELKSVSITEGMLTNEITLTTTAGITIKAGGLPKSESMRILRELQGQIRDIQSQIKKKAEDELNRNANQDAQAITPLIEELDAEISEFLSKERYTRHSETTPLQEAARQLSERCSTQAEDKLSQRAKQNLGRIRRASQGQSLETDRKRSNKTFLQRTQSTVQAVTRDVLPNGITQEQAKAVAIDEECTLVLAGAGTGKTTTTIGKIAHLVRNKDVDPGSILALAFNNKAANEIRERLPEDLQGITANTFHAFGRGVIAAAGTAPTVSKMAGDDFAFGKAMQGILENLARDPDLAKKILNLTCSMPGEYYSPFDFSTPAEYNQHIKDIELRTLKGDLVKSFEELHIANYLTAQGIEFKYEDPYEINTASNQYRQYQPDFHILTPNIYIEHFALDRNGNPPPGWTGYAEGAQWKREIHQQNGTTLVETHSWQKQDGILLTTLRDKLQELGVEFYPVPAEELIKKLAAARITWLAHLLGTFLNHAKSGNLTRDELDQLGQKSQDRKRTEHFLEIFHNLRDHYEQMLAEENAIDFHDMINRAADIIRKDRWKNPYEHVLVDEFQDISSGRMAMLEALRRKNTAYFLVGDDWQSINRFAGSQVSLIHECDQHLGYTERTALTETFRFGEDILKPSGRFIQKNPEQTKRELNTQRDGEGIVVIPDPDQKEGLAHTLSEIIGENEERKPQILVLGRYRAGRNLLNGFQEIPANLEFSTIHAAKGREAEYVIVVDLKDDRHGFPCLTQDDPLLELVLPQTNGNEFPNAEERRLFYVAITRASRATYLVTDSDRPSPFVRELLDDSPEVDKRSALAPKCPVCPRGSLIRSLSRDNLRCTNYPGCGYLAPKCPECQKGYVVPEGQQARCSNPDCGEQKPICPRCLNGVLTLREGRNGPFWGCSRFRDDPSCRYISTGDPPTSEEIDSDQSLAVINGIPADPKAQGAHVEKSLDALWRR